MIRFKTVVAHNRHGKKLCTKLVKLKKNNNNNPPHRRTHTTNAKTPIDFFFFFLPDFSLGHLENRETLRTVYDNDRVNQHGTGDPVITGYWLPVRGRTDLGTFVEPREESGNGTGSFSIRVSAPGVDMMLSFRFPIIYLFI